MSDQQIVQATVLDRQRPDPSQGMQLLALFRETGEPLFPGGSSRVEEYSYEGGEPAEGRQTFNVDYSVTSFLKEKDDSWVSLTLTEGVWLLSAGVIVSSAPGVQAWATLVPMASWPQAEDWEIGVNAGSWVGTETMIATDFKIWPEGFDDVSQILLLTAPYVVPAGEEKTFIIGIGTDSVDGVVTARQQNPADQYFRALKVG